MKKNIYLLNILFCILITNKIFSQNYMEFESKYAYYYATLYSKNVTYYKYYIPANIIGVFTLKNQSNQSDFDIYVYSDYQMNHLLATGEGSGTTTELAVVATKDYGRYVYIKILNYGSYTSTYHFYAHLVDPSEKFGIAVLENLIVAIFSEENNEEANQNLSRVVTGVSSMLQGNNLGGFSRDLLINEMRIALREELGFGLIADVLIGTVVYIIIDVYKNV